MSIYVYVYLDKYIYVHRVYVFINVQSGYIYIAHCTVHKKIALKYCVLDVCVVKASLTAVARTEFIRNIRNPDLTVTDREQHVAGRKSKDK